MRPKHLKAPFKWQQRQVTIEDRIWYIPKCSEEDPFVFPGWTSALTFAKTQPLQVEFCSGNGDWIITKALAHPEKNWVAIEKKFPRVRKIWSKLKNHGIDNLIVICGEGHQAVKRYFFDQSIEAVYVNFPDPWPKNAHAKHRLIQPSFIAEVARCMQIGGSLILVTDDICYSQKAIEEILQSRYFTSNFPSPFYLNKMEGYGSSFFEDLWRGQGKEIRYHQFKLIANGDNKTNG